MNQRRNIKLLIAFDGTEYAGWQKQKSEVTIQGVIEDRLTVMTGERVSLHGAGRTDAGVHALGMVANFDTAVNVPCRGFVKGLNSLLPEDIRILAAEEAAADFHARRSARAKTYWYNLSVGPVQQPTERLYWTHCFGELDFEAIKAGLNYISGTHDFSSFEAAGSRDPESGRRGAVRTLFAAEFIRVGDEEHYRFIFSGDGFLRHMVRNIVGTMLQIGQARKAPAEIGEILAARDRSAAGPTAPPRGLFLKKIFYDQYCIDKENASRNL